MILIVKFVRYCIVRFPVTNTDTINIIDYSWDFLAKTFLDTTLTSRSPDTSTNTNPSFKSLTILSNSAFLPCKMDNMRFEMEPQKKRKKP